jgi:TolA-binding protein
VARYGGKGWRSNLVVLLLVLAPLMLSAGALAKSHPDPKAQASGKAVNLAPITQALEAVTDAQRSLAASIAQVQQQLQDLQGRVNQLQDTVQQGHAAAQGTLDQTQASLEQLLEQFKEAREEVRGLYVESSGVKSDVAQVGKQVETLDQDLGGFRLSSGVVVAVVIVLQVVLVGLMFRGRG